MKNLFKIEKPISVLQAILTIIFVACLMLSNIVSARLFDFFGMSMTCAVIIFPITYILSDLFSEIYGYKWSRITCYIAFALNIFSLIVFLIVNSLPFVIEEQANAFSSILVGTFSCTIASFIAFVVGDFVNDKVFEKMKKKHIDSVSHKGFVFRAVLSSFLGELVDSCIYLPIAFLLLNPIMSVLDVIKMIFVQVSIKILYEIIILPITVIIVKKVDKYEQVNKM